MAVKRLPRGLIFVKMLLVLAGLGVLLHWAGASLPEEVPGVTPTAVVLALLLNQASLYVAALRLRATLVAFDIRISHAQSQLIHLRSLFYFFFVPMSVGLEISRFMAIRRLAPDTATRPLVIALLIDRILGMTAALCATLALAALVLPRSASVKIEGIWILIGLLAAVGAGLALFLHQPLRRQVMDILGAVASRAHRLMLPALLGFVTLALVAASAYAFAVASGISIGWWSMLFALSASILGMAIPISLLGAGLGEVFGVGILALLGLTPAAALLLAAVIYCGRLIGAMQGAVIELLVDAERVSRAGVPGAAATHDR